MTPTGSMTRNDLYRTYPIYIRQINALNTGTRPNLELRDGTYYLTRCGYDNLVRNNNSTNIGVTRENCPEYIRTDSSYRQRTRRRR